MCSVLGAVNASGLDSPGRLQSGAGWGGTGPHLNLAPAPMETHGLPAGCMQASITGACRPPGHSPVFPCAFSSLSPVFLRAFSESFLAHSPGAFFRLSPGILQTFLAHSPVFLQTFSNLSPGIIQYFLAHSLDLLESFSSFPQLSTNFFSLVLA